jgi:hypothetical protein
MEDKRKAYEEKLDAQLEEWNAQIDKGGDHEGQH